MVKAYKLAALSLSAVLIAAQAARPQGAGGVRASPVPKPPPTPDQLVEFGKLDGATYTNEHFGITVTAPKGWLVASLDDLKRMRQSAKALFKDEKDESIRRQLEESVDRTTALFSAQKSPAAPGSFTASLMLAAERVPTAIIKSPRDYYDVMLHSMKLSRELEAEVLEPFRTKRIGTTDFGMFTVKLSSNRGVSIQKQLISIKPPYVYGLVYTYADEADAGAFDEALRSVRGR